MLLFCLLTCVVFLPLAQAQSLGDASLPSTFDESHGGPTPPEPAPTKWLAQPPPPMPVPTPWESVILLMSFQDFVRWSRLNASSCGPALSPNPTKTRVVTHTKMDYSHDLLIVLGMLIPSVLVAFACYCMKSTKQEYASHSLLRPVLPADLH